MKADREDDREDDRVSEFIELTLEIRADEAYPVREDSDPSGMISLHLLGAVIGEIISVSGPLHNGMLEVTIRLQGVLA